MKNAAARTEQVIEQPARVRALRKRVEATADGLWPAIELSRTYIDGTENLPPGTLVWCRSKTNPPAARRITASETLTTAPNAILPTTYNAAVVGVPRSRRKPPVSRSAAMLMPKLMNDVDRMP